MTSEPCARRKDAAAFLAGSLFFESALGAGIPHVRFHDLRHTAASEMLRRGLLLREVQ